MREGSKSETYGISWTEPREAWRTSRWGKEAPHDEVAASERGRRKPHPAGQAAEGSIFWTRCRGCTKHRGRSRALGKEPLGLPSQPYPIELLPRDNQHHLRLSSESIRATRRMTSDRHRRFLNRPTRATVGCCRGDDGIAAPCLPQRGPCHRGSRGTALAA
jgi:hypothetical protein